MSAWGSDRWSAEVKPDIHTREHYLGELADSNTINNGLWIESGWNIRGKRYMGPEFGNLLITKIGRDSGGNKVS